MAKQAKEWVSFGAPYPSPSGKTDVYHVYPVQENGLTLGYISFRPAWRCYVFNPHRATLYNADCLRQIADFCEQKTKDWRNAQRR